jgi:hypothetical protein
MLATCYLKLIVGKPRLFRAASDHCRVNGPPPCRGKHSAGASKIAMGILRRAAPRSSSAELGYRRLCWYLVPLGFPCRGYAKRLPGEIAAWEH